MSNVEPRNVKVRELLSGDGDTRYAVPRYQRNFEWKKEQAEELWQDISVDKIFLGTVVLNPHATESDRITTIVDGQQRLTTISILLAACRVRARQLENEQLASEIQRKLSFISDIDGTTKESKLVVSKSIKDAYDQTIANGEWDGKSFDIKSKKRQVNKIKPIYQYFWERIKKYDLTDLGKLLENLYASNFVAIYIQNEEDAFDIFERTNARGLELNAAELLKNYFYAEEVSEDLDKLWDEIIERSNGNILRLIKYFYVAEKGYVQKKDLYRELKKLGAGRGAQELFDDLRDFADYYYLTATGSDSEIKDWAASRKIEFFQNESHQESLRSVLAALSLFGVTQAYPVIIALMRRLPKENTAYARAFLDFLFALEKFLFVNYAVSQSPGNQIEVYLADKCRELALAKDSADIMMKIKKDLRGKLVGKGEFIERFSSLSYETDKALIYYFFDRLNDFKRKGGERLRIYNPDHKLLRKNYDCDHFVPQKYTDTWPKKEELDEVMHTIGNMVVIARHTNGAMNNALPAEKFSILKDKQRHISYVMDFVDQWSQEDWSGPIPAAKNVRARTEQLAVDAYERVWKF